MNTEHQFILAILFRFIESKQMYFNVKHVSWKLLKLCFIRRSITLMFNVRCRLQVPSHFTHFILLSNEYRWRLIKFIIPINLKQKEWTLTSYYGRRVHQMRFRISRFSRKMNRNPYQYRTIHSYITHGLYTVECTVEQSQCVTNVVPIIRPRFISNWIEMTVSSFVLREQKVKIPFWA